MPAAFQTQTTTPSLSFTSAPVDSCKIMYGGHNTNGLDLRVIDNAYGSFADLYSDVLQVNELATHEQIQLAYFDRRSELFTLLAKIDAKSAQNDSSTNERAITEKKMDAVVLAVRLLGDPEQRLLYDGIRHDRITQRLRYMNQDSATKSSKNSSSQNDKHDKSGRNNGEGLMRKPSKRKSRRSRSVPRSEAPNLGEDIDRGSMTDGGEEKTPMARYSSPAREYPPFDTTVSASNAVANSKVNANSVEAKKASGEDTGNGIESSTRKVSPRKSSGSSSSNKNKREQQRQKLEQDQQQQRRQRKEHRDPAAESGKSRATKQELADTEEPETKATESNSKNNIKSLIKRKYRFSRKKAMKEPSPTDVADEKKADEDSNDGRGGEEPRDDVTYDDDDDLSSVGLTQNSGMLSCITNSNVLRTISEEISGAFEDTMVSMDQVVNAFTLTDQDIRAVTRRINKAKRQLDN